MLAQVVSVREHKSLEYECRGAGIECQSNSYVCVSTSHFENECRVAGIDC